MKALTTFIGLLSISSTLMAATATCKLEVLLANSAGLMPSEKLVSITTSVQSSSAFSLAKCAGQSLNEMKLNLCVLETDIVGGFSANLISSSNSTDEDKEPFILASADFATAKVTHELIQIRSQAEVLNKFLEAANQASVNAPLRLESDSYNLDKAVEALVAQKKYVVNEPVVISLDSCIINK